MEGSTNYNPKIENRDLIKEMFNEKLNRLEQNVHMIVSLIEERNQLCNQAIKDIDGQAMIAKGRIYTMESLFKYSNPHLDSVSNDIKKIITELEVSKIKERVNAWKDMAMLKQMLLNHMNDMAMAKTRINLLKGARKND